MFQKFSTKQLYYFKNVLKNLDFLHVSRNFTRIGNYFAEIENLTREPRNVFLPLLPLLIDVD